jgi:DNA modification methylase
MAAPAEPDLAIRETPLAALHPAPDNPRKITPERLAQLKRSLEADREMLAVRPLIALLDGTVVCGNQRLRAAQALGWETIPAVVVDLDDRRAKEWMLRDNNQFGEWVPEDLAGLLDSLRLDGADLDLLGFDERELQQLLDRATKGIGLTDPDDVPPLPDEPITKPGDLYVLGDHRVLCGDATNRDDVAMVMDGRQSACMWTDPPYGVSYQGGTKEHLTLKNDRPETLEALLAESFMAADQVLAPGAAVYVCHPAGALSLTFGQQFLARGWRLHQTLVWVKDSIVLGRSDYHYRHEPVLFGYKPAEAGRRGRGSRGWYGGNDAGSVFEVPRPRASPDHPTAKPVPLITAMLRNSTRTGDVVLDPYLGSGSTLIACEELGRVCCGLELDPRYVDVVVKRWEHFTGQKAECVKGSGT